MSSRKASTPRRTKSPVTTPKRRAKKAVEEDGESGESGRALSPIDLDLGLTPGRTSFNDKGSSTFSSIQTMLSSYIWVALMIVSILSMWLSPFRKEVKVYSEMHASTHSGGSECMCNSTTLDFLHGEMSRLASELEAAKSTALDGNRQANDILSLQYSAIRDVELSVASLSSKQQEIMRVTDDSKRSEATGNVFSHIREDMQRLRSQVQSLSDTHLMIQQFNSHADSLNQRSKEIEALIVAQNESSIETMPAACDCSAEATCPPSGIISESGHQDYVNIAMARQIITDEVNRECKTKIDEVYRIYDAKMASYGEECSHQCNEMQATRDAGKAGVGSERRVNYASRKAGASVVVQQTSATWAPPQTAGLARRAVQWASHSEGWLDAATRKVASRGVADIIDLSQVESTLNGVVDFMGLGAPSAVGVPEDALSADMTLGSCWPIDQGRGHLTIKLARPVRITGIAIEHIPRNEALDVRSAPRDFKISSLDDPRANTPEGALILAGSYSIDNQSPATQVFDVDVSSGLIQYIRVDILSNHGHPDFACLYRVKVFGRTDD